MTYSVFFLVLLAALTHAIWNSWLKVSGDRLVALAVIGVGWALTGIVAISILGAPEARAWPYLLASTLVHTIYALALIRSYAQGSLSVAYPIARGLGPLIVAFVTSVFLGDQLGFGGLLGILLIIAGVGWLGAPRSAPAYSSLLFSILTGMLIGTYTLLDGLGGRAGDSPHLFAAWLFLLTAVPVLVIAIAVHRSRFIAIARPIWPIGIGAGLLSAGAYWIVIWAMSEAHMGLVAALRESSVVFAALIGAVLLKEHVRWAGIALVFAGVTLTKLA